MATNFRAILEALLDHEVEFVVVGDVALAFGCSISRGSSARRPPQAASKTSPISHSSRNSRSGTNSSDSPSCSEAGLTAIFL